MIIVMRKGSEKKDADGILDQIRKANLEPLYLPGEEKIVLGALGDERLLASLNLESFDCVERVVPILKPYKLGNREFRKESSIVEIAGVAFGGQRLGIIAGPCAVESESQIIAAAHAVKQAGAHVLRGGAFKPRTSPYAFQGLEKEGLRLLSKAREETGLPICTELLSEHDLEDVAMHTDAFQIGARNMQNFRLLKAVGRTKKPVVLKRGPAASMSELLMAAEYILSQGNPNVILCERGIKSFFTDTRNTFDLSIIPLLKEETHLPIIADPSHGTGVRRIVPAMSCAAVAAGADGLIIEVHPRPEEAMSDGFQQLDPPEFEALMKSLQALVPTQGRVL